MATPKQKKKSVMETLHENKSASNSFDSMGRVFKGFIKYNDLSQNSKYASTYMGPEEMTHSSTYSVRKSKFIKTSKYRHGESLVSTKQELTPTEDYPKGDDPKPSSSRNEPEIKYQDVQTQAGPQVSLKTNNDGQSLLSKHKSMSKMDPAQVIRKQIPEKDIPQDNSVSEDSSSVSDDRDEQTQVIKRDMLPTRRQNILRKSGRSVSVISLSNCSHVSLGSGREDSQITSVTLEDVFRRIAQSDMENKERLNEILERNLKFAIHDAKLLLRKHRKKGAFINTEAFKKAKAKLIGHSLVVISGNPGDGKSAIGFELLNYFSKDNNDIGEAKIPLMITTVNEFRAVQGVFKHAILFLDNFLESNKHAQSPGKWQAMFDRIVHIAEHSSIMIIVSLDKHIFKEHEMVLRRYKLFSKEYRIDLTDDKFQLPDDQKELILLAHLKRMRRNFENLDLKKIASQHQHFGYPLCCVLFAENDHCFQQREKFFKHPLECICKEVDSYMSHDKNKYKYWVLVSVLKCNGISEDIVNLDTQPKSKEMREITKLAGKCECDRSLKKFRDSLLSIEDSFIIFNPDTSKYQFSSDIIKEAVFIVYGRFYPEEVIQHVSRYTLYHYIKVDECEYACVCLHLQRKHYSFLIKRFLHEIKNGHTETLAKHVAWRTRGFYRVLYSMVQGKQILQLYAKVDSKINHRLLYWVLVNQDDNMDFFGSLLEHLNSQTPRSFCCLPNLRKRLLRREMYECLRRACDTENEKALKLLKHYGVDIDRNIIETCKRRHQHKVLQILDPHDTLRVRYS